MNDDLMKKILEAKKMADELFSEKEGLDCPENNMTAQMTIQLIASVCLISGISGKQLAEKMVMANKDEIVNFVKEVRAELVKLDDKNSGKDKEKKIDEMIEELKKMKTN